MEWFERFCDGVLKREEEERAREHGPELCDALRGLVEALKTGRGKNVALWRVHAVLKKVTPVDMSG